MSASPRSLDLNLLPVFNVLMEERSVTRAAVRLGLSQSSASNALERLRAALGDRVLEREGNRMIPTMAALELWPKVRAALAEIDGALAGLETIDPGRIDVRIAIGIDEYALTVFGPAIVARLSKAAPKATFDLVSCVLPEDAERLFAGEVDLAIATSWRMPAGLTRETLAEEDFMGVVDAGHPLAAGAVTLDDYVRYPHVLVSRRGIVPGNIDAALRPTGRRRTVALATPFFANAHRFVRGTDRILNLGRRLAGQVAASGDLATFELPVAAPGFDISLVWHPRNTAGARHRWLRGEVKAALAA